MNRYLIPANSKKSLYIFGLFTPKELTLFASGVGTTLLFLMILPVEQLTFALIALLPALITGFLVMPIPNYHNMMTVIKSMFEFFTTRQRFVWKGWCYNSGEEEKK